MNASRSDERNRSAFLQLTLFVSVIMIAFTACIVYLIVKMRFDAIEESNKASTQIAKIMAEQVGRSTQSINIMLDELIEWVDRRRDGAPNDFADEMKSRNTFEFLNSRLDKLPQATAIAVVDQNGDVLASTRTWPLRKLNVSERDHFRTFSESDRSSLYVSEKVSNVYDGVDAVIFSKPQRRLPGHFNGTIIITVTPEYFIQIHDVISSFAGRRFTLLRTDGSVLNQQGELFLFGGDKIPKASPWYDVSGRGGGIYRTTQLLDPRPAWVSVEPVNGYPLVVDISTLENSVLATWRRQSVALGLGTFIFDILLIILIRALYLQYLETTVSRARLHVTLSHMSHGLAMYDSNGLIQIHNPRYREIWGFSESELTPGTPLSWILSKQVELGLVPVSDAATHVIRNDVRHDKTASEIRRLSDRRSIRINYDPTPDGGWITTHEDITESEANSARISHLASYDSLTNLANRSLFTQKLQEIQEKSEASFAILLLDLDRFKEVNDTFGHAIGDELLRQVAIRLSSVVRGIDIVARLGGDEFAIIREMDHTGNAGLMAQANRLLEAIRAPYLVEGHDLIVGVSIGIADASPAISGLDAMRHADLALYRAKREGRNRVCHFDPLMEEGIRVRRELAIELQGAIAREELAVHYQPIVDGASLQIRAMEALVRWPHGKRGFVSPVEFIPLAEESGLIDRLGLLVLRTACKDAARWPGEVRLAVNVSPIQVLQGSFPETVADILNETGFPASRLKLEITESLLLSDSERALDALHRLRSMGIATVLDDFGTGFSSLSYLKLFPFDEIKVDRSFVGDMENHKGSAAIISATTTLARAFNILITAEGVETEEQLHLLQAIPVDFMQGYLFAKPAAAAVWDPVFKRGLEIPDSISSFCKIPVRKMASIAVGV